ncbi:hypothetical protein M1466_01020 [Candidatus Dependentiae bacterium]|nr:hypothetical protein [Candidatus Dependentiae bacterium]
MKRLLMAAIIAGALATTVVDTNAWWGRSYYPYYGGYSYPYYGSGIGFGVGPFGFGLGFW